MASHRKHVIVTTKAVNTSGSVGQRDGYSVRNVHQTPRKQPMLLAYEELPAWYQDNKHILQGYRPESLSMSACFLSWTYLHNETFNIYSHLIPAIIFMFAQVFILCLLPQTFPEAKPLDYVAFSCFLLSACITLSLSFLYHTLMNHSMGVSYFLLRLDYVGILALTLGDFVSGIRVGFYCHPSLQKIYWSMTLTLGLITSIFVIHPKFFRGPKHRKLRIAAFATLALSCLVPIAHGLVIYGFHRMWVASGLPYYLLEGAILALGAFFYATRCPESIKPGSFDIWGCSHNIFHLLVVLATVVHLSGIWNAFVYNYRNVQCQAE